MNKLIVLILIIAVHIFELICFCWYDSRTQSFVMPGKDNLNPLIHQKTTARVRVKIFQELDNNIKDPFDCREIFDLIETSMTLSIP